MLAQSETTKSLSVSILDLNKCPATIESWLAGEGRIQYSHNKFALL